MPWLLRIARRGFGALGLAGDAQWVIAQLGVSGAMGVTLAWFTENPDQAITVCLWGTLTALMIFYVAGQIYREETVFEMLKIAAFTVTEVVDDERAGTRAIKIRVFLENYAQRPIYIKLLKCNIFIDDRNNAGGAVDSSVHLIYPGRQQGARMEFVVGLEQKQFYEGRTDFQIEYGRTRKLGCILDYNSKLRVFLNEAIQKPDVTTLNIKAEHRRMR